MSVEGPIIIDEHGVLEVHPAAQTAVSGLEAIDVLNDEYEAFDVHGESLDLLVLDQRIVLPKRVAPEIDRAGVAGRLRRAARAYEPSQLDDLDLEQADLDELVAALLVVKPRRPR